MKDRENIDIVFIIIAVFGVGLVVGVFAGLSSLRYIKEAESMSATMESLYPELRGQCTVSMNCWDGDWNIQKTIGPFTITPMNHTKEEATKEK